MRAREPRRLVAPRAAGDRGGNRSASGMGPPTALSCRHSVAHLNREASQFCSQLSCFPPRSLPVRESAMGMPTTRFQVSIQIQRCMEKHTQLVFPTPL